MRYEIFADGVCPLLRISSIGYAAEPSVTRFGPGRRDTYIIHYILSGKGSFNGNPVKAGQGFLITPGMDQEYHGDPADPWEYVWFISDDSRIGELYPLFGADENTHVFDYTCIETVRKLADTLVRVTKRYYDPFEMTDRFLEVFRRHRHTLPRPSMQSAAVMYQHAATDYIRANISRPITVTELTTLLGVSQPYLYTIFRNAFRLSPKQYILEQKLTRAKELLTDTAISVTQVAASVGYEDVLAFSKFFTTRQGISPLIYRKMHKKTAE